MFVSSEVYETINAYLERMLELNKNINLTNINDFDKARILHIEDSLYGLEFIDLNSDSKILDLGSGCGFPGVALGIASNLDTTLLDSSTKKMRAVDKILDDLNLSSLIHTISIRAEEYALENHKFNYVVSRAVSTLPSILELCTPFVDYGGKIILYKGDISDDELIAGNSLTDIFGLSIIDDKRFYLSDGFSRRSLLVYMKVSEPSVKLPRRNGKAQKSPMKRIY